MLCKAYLHCWFRPSTKGRESEKDSEMLYEWSTKRSKRGGGRGRREWGEGRGERGTRERRREREKDGRIYSAADKPMMETH